MIQLLTSILIVISLSVYHFTVQESNNTSQQADPPPRDRDQW